MSKIVCVWCGFETFNEFLSGFEICPVCNYQDSIMWLLYPFDLSCNWEQTLIDYQKWTVKNIWNYLKKYKTWRQTYYRNKNWQPIDEAKFNKEHIYIPKYYYDYLDNPLESFIEKFQEAQKHNPDDDIHLEM